MPTRLVAVKLTATEFQAVEQLVEHGRYDSLSAVLRTGLVLLLRQEQIKPAALQAIRLERITHGMRRRKRANEKGR